MFSFQVNNAGISVRGTCQSVSLDDYDRQMNINVRYIIYHLFFFFLNNFHSISEEEYLQFFLLNIMLHKSFFP